MKKTIFGFVLGILVSGSVVFAANYLYQADEVSYTPDNNEWDVDNVDDALKDLYNRISSSNEALTNLKNTAIAKAVGADGNDFSSVINRLGTIVNQGNKSFTISDTNALTIPAGYYNGTGTITANGLVPTPTGTKSITANGSNIDVKNYATVNVNVATTPTYNSYSPTGEQSYIHMDPNGNTQSGSAYISITGCNATISNGKLYINLSERVKVGGPPVAYGQNLFSNDTRTIQVVFNLS